MWTRVGWIVKPFLSETKRKPLRVRLDRDEEMASCFEFENRASALEIMTKEPYPRLRRAADTVFGLAVLSIAVSFFVAIGLRLAQLAG